MPSLPRISGDKAIKAFCKCGFSIDRYRGSHVMLTKENFPFTLSVPRHKELDTGTLRDLIKTSGLTVDDFKELL